MSDTTNDPQAIDPPVSTGGGGTSSDTEETENADVQAIDPPVSTGGGGGS